MPITIIITLIFYGVLNLSHLWGNLIGKSRFSLIIVLLPLLRHPLPWWMHKRWLNTTIWDRGIYKLSWHCTRLLWSRQNYLRLSWENWIIDFKNTETLLYELYVKFFFNSVIRPFSILSFYLYCATLLCRVTLELLLLLLLL